jgi:hypothetical protein
MTLAIAAAGKEFSILVADRLLIIDGSFEDTENKAAVLFCRDGRAAIGFTGLAVLGNFTTRRWLLEALTRAVQPDCLIEPSIARFAQEATGDIGSLHVADPRHKRLSFLFVGYRYDRGLPRAHFWLVSNFDSLNDELLVETPRHGFGVTSVRDALRDREAAGVCSVGVEGALRPDAETLLGAHLQAGTAAESVRDAAVDLLREAADTPAGRGRIARTVKA